MSAAVKMGTMQDYQLKLEELFDKHQTLPRVRQYFQERKDVPFAAAMRTARIPEEFGFDMLAQIAVHKRANVPTMVGCLRRHCKTDQEVCDLLERAVKGNFIRYENGTFIVGYEIDPQLQDELDKFQYPLPMVVEPAPLKNNLDTGYLTQKGSVILRNNHHKEDVCLDHLNRMNRVKLSINLDVANTIQNKWKGLDKKQEDESWDDYKKRRKAFEKYCSVADTVIGIMVKAGNCFSFTHRYDKRGRTYCMGFHLTTQGTDWNKAVLELAHKEHLND